MLPDDFAQGRILIDHRLRLIVQESRRVSPSIHGSGQPTRIQVDGELVHDPLKNNLSILHGKEPGCRFQHRGHIRLKEERNGEAVTRHASGMQQVPGKQCRKLKRLVVTSKNGANQGIFTPSPG